jgi:Flp pilus assembly protein TadG
MTAFLVLIPIGLAGIDIACAVSSAQTNEQLAETAARAAASQGNQKAAQNAAQDAVDRFTPGSIITSATLGDVNFDTNTATVQVQTTVTVKLPVPVPYFKEFTSQASSTQPIVALPPPT